MADPARATPPSSGIGQAHFSHILSQAFGGVVGRVATVLFATLNILLLAVILAPRDYGIYLLFIRTISLIGLLGDFGLGQSAASHFSLFAALDKRLHGTFVRIIAASSVLT